MEDTDDEKEPKPEREPLQPEKQQNNAYWLIVGGVLLGLAMMLKGD